MATAGCNFKTFCITKSYTLLLALPADKNIMVCLDILVVLRKVASVRPRKRHVGIRAMSLRLTLARLLPSPKVF